MIPLAYSYFQPLFMSQMAKNGFAERRAAGLAAFLTSKTFFPGMILAARALKTCVAGY